MESRETSELKALSTFVSVTNADPDVARRILQGHNWDLDTAINLYLENDGNIDTIPPRVVDLEAEQEEAGFGPAPSFGPAAQPRTVPASSTPPYHVEVPHPDTAASMDAEPSVPSNTNIVDLTEEDNAIEEEMLQAALNASRETEGTVPQEGLAGHADDELAQAIQQSLQQEQLGAGDSAEDLIAEPAAAAELSAPATQSGGQRQMSSVRWRPLPVAHLGPVEQRSRATGGLWGDHQDVAENGAVRPLPSRRPDPSRPLFTQEHDAAARRGRARRNMDIERALPSSLPERSSFQDMSDDDNDDHDDEAVPSYAHHGRGRRPAWQRLPQFANGAAQSDEDGDAPGPAPNPDDAYQQSLAADRAKARAAEQAQQEVRRAEEQARAESEAEAQRLQQEEEELRQQMLTKSQRLSKHGEPDASALGAVRLLVRMPDGSRLERRFLRDEPLQLLFDFIDVAGSVKPGTYQLVTRFPRKVFADGATAQSFQDAGLSGKQEALFLELL
eukprot:jgi/Chlat1/2202/Chrsp17S02760